MVGGGIRGIGNFQNATFDLNWIYLVMTSCFKNYLDGVEEAFDIWPPKTSNFHADGLLVGAVVAMTLKTPPGFLFLSSQFCFLPSFKNLIFKFSNFQQAWRISLTKLLCVYLNLSFISKHCLWASQGIFNIFCN